MLSLSVNKNLIVANSDSNNITIFFHSVNHFLRDFFRCSLFASLRRNFPVTANQSTPKMTGGVATFFCVPVIPFSKKRKTSPCVFFLFFSNQRSPLLRKRGTRLFQDSSPGHARWPSPVKHKGQSCTEPPFFSLRLYGVQNPVGYQCTAVDVLDRVPLVIEPPPLVAVSGHRAVFSSGRGQTVSLGRTASRFWLIPPFAIRCRTPVSGSKQ